MSAILIGYRGSGKTTIGKRLADKLWLKFIDTDDLVVKAAGKSIREIFDAAGEEHFRQMESAALLQALSLKDHIVSCGGGIVLREANRLDIQSAKRPVIYLRCDPAVLHQRIHSDPATASTRPSLTALGGTLEEVRSLLETREPLYRAIKTAELDVTSLSINDALAHIARMI